VRLELSDKADTTNLERHKNLHGWVNRIPPIDLSIGGIAGPSVEYYLFVAGTGLDWNEGHYPIERGAEAIEGFDTRRTGKVVLEF
jgi:hypothetical protein